MSWRRLMVSFNYVFVWKFNSPEMFKDQSWPFLTWKFVSLQRRPLFEKSDTLWCVSLFWQKIYFRFIVNMPAILPDQEASAAAAASKMPPVEEPETQDQSDLKLRSPKRQSSTVYEKVCAKLSRSLTSSVSSPSLKKAPLASEDDLEDDLKNSPRVQLRKSASNGGGGQQRRCHSEVCCDLLSRRG